MTAVKPKKALGQHFLTDNVIAQRIASTVADLECPIIEVGPGMGMLTRHLIDFHRPMKVVEIDKESVGWLRTHVPELNVEDIVEGDFLKMNLDEFFPGHRVCVIGNYPYNISSQIFFHILNFRDKVTCCAGMLQKEVAERLAAKPGTKARGILSVLLQAWYHVEYLFTVDETVFNPVPKVKSGVIRITRNNVNELGCDEKQFKTVIKTTFSQRRKTLRNSLKPLISPGWHPDPGVESMMGRRPEELSVDDFIQLTRAVYSLE